MQGYSGFASIRLTTKNYFCEWSRNFVHARNFVRETDFHGNQSRFGEAAHKLLPELIRANMDGFCLRLNKVKHSLTMRDGDASLRTFELVWCHGEAPSLFSRNLLTAMVR